ncbi:MAG: protein-L-isoaspartate O-methyltransferase family protein [Caulobacteraceae bacterium]
MSADFAAERTNMVDSQVRPQDVTDLSLIDAMRGVAREALAPAGKTWLAYADTEIEYAPGRWMLRPRDVAKLLQALRPVAGERVLAIAAPYAARVLAAMGLEVTPLDAGAESPTPGAFALVVCEGAVTRAPAAWLAALADGGRLGVVERDGPVGRAMLYLRSGDNVGPRVLFDSTPPVLAGFEAEHGFAF